MSVSARLPDCVVKPGLKVQRVHIFVCFFYSKKVPKVACLQPGCCRHCFSCDPDQAAGDMTRG